MLYSVSSSPSTDAVSNEITHVVRFNALSRAVEGALQKEGIPNRVLGGHKFFERLEVRSKHRSRSKLRV